MPRKRFAEITAGDAPVPVERRTRWPQFLGMTLDPGPVLDRLDVTVIGVGSVGRNLAVPLARAQVGTLRLIDPGRFKPESLLTQPIGPGDVGEPKASNTGRLCKALSPRTRVLALDDELQALDPAELAATDLVLLATDNLTAEVEAGQLALRLGRPLIQASVHGETLVAQVRCFKNGGESSACPACGFGAAEWSHLNQETRFSCLGPQQRETLAAPTMSTSFLCALAANLALVQALRYVLRLGQQMSDAMIEYCGYTNRTVTTPLARNPRCPCDHTTWARQAPPRPLADCTPRQLLEAAGCNGDLNGVALRVDDLAFAERLACAACGTRQGFVDQAPGAARCPKCAGPVEAWPFYLHRPAPAAKVTAILDRPLRSVGAGSPRSAAVRGGGRAVWFLDSALDKGSDR